MRTISRGLVACSVLVISAAASAGVEQPGLEMSVEINGTTVWFDVPDGEHQGGTEWLYEGTYEGPAGWSMDWVCEVDTDPSIGLNFSFLNDTGATQVFTINAFLPIDAIVGPSVYGGSVSGTTTDSNFDGLGGVSTDAGGSLYTGFVDNAAVMTLHDDPFSVSYPFAGGTENIPSASSGLPGPTNPGPDNPDTNIGISIDYVLSDGDSIGITSFFQLEPIPAPGAIALLGLAGLVGTRRRRH